MNNLISLFSVIFILLFNSSCSDSALEPLEFVPEDNVIRVVNNELIYHAKPEYTVALYTVDYGEEYRKLALELRTNYKEWNQACKDYGFGKVGETKIGKKWSSLHDKREEILQGFSCTILKNDDELNPYLKKVKEFSNQEFNKFTHNLNNYKISDNPITADP